MNSWLPPNRRKTVLPPEKLRVISDQITASYAPNPEIDLSELVLLPVDPYHLHAYWNLPLESWPTVQATGGQVVLRIFWIADEPVDLATTRLRFDVAIDQPSGHLEVRLPVDDSTYAAALGVRDGYHRLTVLIHSNQIHVPRARLTPAQCNLEYSKLEQALQHLIPSQESPTPPHSHGQHYDERLIDAQIRQALKLRCNPTEPQTDDRADVTERVRYDEQEIDARIRRTLHGKGIGQAIDRDRGADATLSPDTTAELEASRITS